MAAWTIPGYTEIEEIGSGGFGEVVLARHDATGMPVAIKYLRANLCSDPMFIQMFRDEATALASIEDPNVVRLYEYVESAVGAGIVMELVDGVSLREILVHQGATTVEAALVVLEGSLLGLAAAHQRGVVHRDYKPENVLVDGEGTSKLTDFGIAARTGERPLPAGTLRYAAPEQLAGAPASPAGDVYAATATFYECVTGRPPFSGTREELLRQHNSEPVPLELLPEPLRPLIATGMAKELRSRPADAASLVADLQSIASRAYGQSWRRRGRSHLSEAALLLAALWPMGAAAAQQGTAMGFIQLRQLEDQPGFRQRWASRPLRAAIAVAGIAVIAAITTLAVPAPRAETADAMPSTADLTAFVPPTPKIQVTVSTPPHTEKAKEFSVVYGGGSDGTAQIGGEVINAVNGEVVTLYAQHFPFAAPPTPAASVDLSPVGTIARYTFRVTPIVLTRYSVKVFRSRIATTPLVSSPISVIYVIPNYSGSLVPTCAGTQCQAAWSVTISVPPSALKTEMSSTVYTYFALNYEGFSPSSPSRVLSLGAGNPVIGAPRQISADKYTLTIKFSYPNDPNSISVLASVCKKPLYLKDGIGSPGGSDCGSRTMSYG